MNNLSGALHRLVENEEGAAAAEYAILVAFVAATIAVAVSEFDLNPIFQTIATKIQNLITGA